MAELMSTLRVNENDYTIKDAAAWSRIDDLYAIKESTDNKVTTIGPDSTDTEYPTAKAVWNLSNLVYIPYSSPNYADITALVAAGKTPYTYDDTNKALMIFTRTYNYMHHFSSLYFMEGALWIKDRVVNQSNAWANRGTCTLVKTVGQTSNNDQFPTAKAVYDFVKGITDNKQNKLYKHAIDFSRATGSTVDIFFITMFLTESDNNDINTPAGLLDVMAMEYGANINLPASGYFFNTSGETVQVLHMRANPYAYSGIGAFIAYGINESTGLYEGREFINTTTDIAVSDTVTGV